MDREEFIKASEKLKTSMRLLQDKQAMLSAQYISDNKPCNTNAKVEITLKSGRKVKGEALTFGILSGKNVCITSYKDANGVKYITVPHREVVIK